MLRAAAFSLAATAGGSLRSIRTIPLLSVDQGISAMSRAAEAGRNDHAPIGAAIPAQTSEVGSAARGRTSRPRTP